MRIFQPLCFFSIAILMVITISNQIKTIKNLNQIEANLKAMYPDGDTLSPDSDGIIHHPTYGDYPADAGEFHQGMSLGPGQSTTIEIAIPLD